MCIGGFCLSKNLKMGIGAKATQRGSGTNSPKNSPSPRGGVGGNYRMLISKKKDFFYKTQPPICIGGSGITRIIRFRIIHTKLIDI